MITIEGPQIRSHEPQVAAAAAGRGGGLIRPTRQSARAARAPSLGLSGLPRPKIRISVNAGKRALRRLSMLYGRVSRPGSEADPDASLSLAGASGGADRRVSP